MPRFYAHFQVLDLDPNCTLIVDLPHAATVAQLTTECCRRYAAFVQHRWSGIDPATVQVSIATKGSLHPEDTLAQHVKNGADVVLSFPEQSPENPDIGTCTGNLPTRTKTPKRAAKPDTAPLQPGTMKQLQDSLEDSTKAMKAKNFRSASKHHDKIFAIDPTNLQACYQQALVELSINAYSSASATLERALTARPPPQEPEIYVKLGEAYDGQGGVHNYQTALQHYDTALGLASASAAYDEDRIDNIKMLMARTLQRAGREEVALQLVESVLQRNEQHKEALVLYGMIMTERYGVALQGFHLRATTLMA